MNLKFIIFAMRNGNPSIYLSPSNQTNGRDRNDDDDVFGFLYIKHLHYSPIKVNGYFLYLWKNIPDVIKNHVLGHNTTPKRISRGSEKQKRKKKKSGRKQKRKKKIRGKINKNP